MFVRTSWYQFDYLQRQSRRPGPGAKHAVQSWFLDLSLLMAYWQGDGARTYHHTAPVNAMYGLHEALLMVQEEGLENSWQRHRAMHEELAKGVQDLGLSFVVDADCRLPQLNLCGAQKV